MNLFEMQHLLPQSARTLIAVIGIESTNQLISKMAGVPFPVPKRRNPKGEARFEELSECIGHEAAEKFCNHFGGAVFEIPRCKKLMRELLNRKIRAEFDALTREHSAAYAIPRLAVKYEMTGRYIRRIVNSPDELAPTAVQLTLL